MHTDQHHLKLLLGSAGGLCFLLLMGTNSSTETHSHSSADAFSRLPLPVVPPETDPPPEVILLIYHLSDSPASARQIRSGTSRDPILSSVLRYARWGWPTMNPFTPKLTPFISRKAELSVQDGCLLWGSRVIVQPQNRKAVLSELHEAHPGITRMKVLVS